ncbi:MAG: sigma-70 family RNA polymerase sigma factor [Phycisphaerales bacterium]|nr:MAG: sigma-70 family RNA polymerase sigma factor [Phycisphaerales bacterium]
MAMMGINTERALIGRARRGDAIAIEGLIRAHQDALYAFILRMSGRPDVAEDIVQEAFVRVLNNLDRFDDRFRFSTWVFTIAKRLYVNWIQKHRPAYDTETVNARQCHQESPGGVTARREVLGNIRGLIETALAGLNEQQREIILLFHQQSWPITTIAEHLDMPEGTVKSHLHRARKRMKRLITANRKMHEQVQEAWS